MTNEITMHHATRTKLEKLQAILAAEYPALTIAPVADELGKAVGFQTSWTDSEATETILVLETKKVPEIADIFAACEDRDLDPEDGVEDDDEARAPSSSIVPETYRKQYKQNSTTGRSNGDWLAERLATDALDANGKLSIEAFTSILEANGVDLTGKWAQARFQTHNGAPGRYRMNGRQVMEKTVAKTGQYFGPNGEEHTPDPEFLADIRAKHAKWLAKEAKREAAAEAVAEGAAA